MAFKKQFNLTGKVSVITGACGVLGKRFCAGLAEFGSNVAVIDLNEEEAVGFAREISTKYNVKSVGVGCDVSNSESVKSMVIKVKKELGEIDILHNNAASRGSSLEKFFAPFDEYSIETWKEVMAVNLDGVFLVAQEIGSLMAKRGSGSIIQTSSIYGATMGPDHSIYQGSHHLGMAINTPPVYPAAKAGVVGLTLYLATLWADCGVRVNTLTPGGVESGQNKEFNNRYSNRVPMKRMANKDEMVGALIFLASDASSYVTGQNIIIDGGLSAW
jgi:NAD(P)-dependent dehydrogenase (short-subunit alcohol dehydrogenase family)